MACSSLINSSYCFSPHTQVLEDQQNIRLIRELLQTLYTSLCTLVQRVGKSVLVGNINMWVYRMETILHWQQQLNNIQITRVSRDPPASSQQERPLCSQFLCRDAGQPHQDFKPALVMEEPRWLCSGTVSWVLRVGWGLSDKGRVGRTWQSSIKAHGGWQPMERWEKLETWPLDQMLAIPLKSSVGSGDFCPFPLKVQVRL